MNSLQAIHSVEELQQCLENLQSVRRMSRPFIAVSYAQGIDGSIATADRNPLAISGKASMHLTHRLRAAFDGILIGINTLLADDPQLTVRLADGNNPQPVVLDTHLRTPGDCNLMRRSDRQSWLASSMHNPKEKISALTRLGAVNLSCPIDRHGLIELHDLVSKLYEMGIGSLMVEGGARVITSFIRARLVDQFIITISPMFIGGLQVLSAASPNQLPPLGLTGIHHQRLGDDLVLWAKPVWDANGNP